MDRKIDKKSINRLSSGNWDILSSCQTYTYVTGVTGKEHREGKNTEKECIYFEEIMTEEYLSLLEIIYPQIQFMEFNDPQI